VGLVAKILYDLGSEHVEGVNAISGERCNPHPHVYTDRVLRPGDRVVAMGTPSQLEALERVCGPGDERAEPDRV